MQREVFLEENKSRLSVNSESNISVNLEEKQRLLPFDNAAETMSLYELYNKQRDNCDRYRLIFNVNPYCTNVLFNAITEPVWKEGSDEAKCLNFTPMSRSEFPNGTINSTEEVNVRQAIKDTEYSHPDIGKIVYHCGYDIFDNHILRSEDFLHMKLGNGNDDKFNTLEDKIIGFDGEIVKERGGRSFRNMGKVERHAYTYDNCMTMTNAYLSRISEENGWYGFTNIGYINIPNGKLNDGKEVSVNKVMNNNKPCEFYDMYPDRSLFSFIPKVNKWRKRLERNWDYKITYPAISDEKLFNELNECPVIEGERTINALKCIKVELTYTNTGNRLIRFRTLFNHGLAKGNFIRLYYVGGEGLERYYTKVKIISVGDYEGYDSDKYFSVAFDDIADIINEENPADKKFYVRREINGVEFKYYLRKFKSLPVEPRSEINKTAYQETIYGDRTAQIVYTDDVDVTGLIDNLGRPLTTLYLTVVKRNKGWYKWYVDGSTNTEDIEFSHCFGKVTSGFDFGNDALDYNIRKMHNITSNDPNTIKMLGWVATSGVPKTVEDNIEITDNEFYGDVACYDTYNCIEYILMQLYHRFNTAQREIISNVFKDIVTDEIQSDDFDYENPEDMGEPEEEGELKTPIISATPQNGEIVLADGEYTFDITIFSEPQGFSGNLVLDDGGTKCAVLSRNGNVYTVAFAENNASEDREVTVYGTLSTLEDIDYNGIATTSLTYTIKQGGSSYPYEYRMTLENSASELGTRESGQTTAKIEKVVFYSDDDHSDRNIRSREILTSGQIHLDEMSWSNNDFTGRFKDPVSSTPDTYQYGNANYTEDPSLPAADIKVKITAEYENSEDHKTASATTTITLKGEVTKWTYSLSVVPTTGKVMTGKEQIYTAEFLVSKNGQLSNQYIVTSACSWTLSDSLKRYIVESENKRGTFIKKEPFDEGVVEPENEVNGSVSVSYEYSGQTYNATVALKYVPNYKDKLKISVVDHFPTAATQMTITLRGRHTDDPDNIYVIQSGITLNAESPALLDVEKGPTGTMEYFVQINNLTGDGESEDMVIYNPPFSSITRRNWQTLSDNIWLSPLSYDKVNNSEFHLSGGTRYMYIDTSSASSNYGTFKLWVDDVFSAQTQNNFVGTTTSPWFYWGALSADAGTNRNVVHLSGSVTNIRDEKYKHFSILIMSSANTKVRDFSLEQVFDSRTSAFTVSGLSRLDITESTWYLIAGRPTFKLSAYTDNDIHLVSYSGTLQHHAVILYDEFTKKGASAVTDSEYTTWSLSGSGFTIANVHISNGENPDESKGMVYNTNNTDYKWSGWVFTEYFNDHFEYRDEILTIDFRGNKKFEQPLTVSGVQAFKVFIKLPAEVDGFYKRISSAATDLFKSFSIDISGSAATENTENKRSNYLIGRESGNDEFRQISGLTVRTLEELENKQFSLKWTGHTSKVDNYISVCGATDSTLSARTDNDKLFLKNSGETPYILGMYKNGGKTNIGKLSDYSTIEVDGNKREMYVTMYGVVVGERINSYEVFVRLPGEVGDNVQGMTTSCTNVPSDYFSRSQGVSFIVDGFVAKDNKDNSSYLIGSQSSYKQVGSAATYENNYRVASLETLKTTFMQVKYYANEEILREFQPSPEPSEHPEDVPNINNLEMFFKFVKEDNTTGYTRVSYYADNLSPETTLHITSEFIDKYAKIVVDEVTYRIYLDMYGLRIGTSGDTVDSGEINDNDGGQTFGAPLRRMMKGGNDLLLGAASTDGAKEFKKDMLNNVDKPCFCVCAVTLSTINGSNVDGDKFYGNLNPEGYFYNPHTPIKIRELSNEISSVDGIVINTDFSDVMFGEETVEVYNPETETIESNKTVNLISATSPTNLDFIEGMEFIFYNKETGDGNIIGRLIDYDDDYEYGCRLNLWLNNAFTSAYTLQNFQRDVTNKKYLIVLKKQWAPSYAVFQPKLKKFIWREIVRPSEMTQDNELYDMSFANGRFYIHQNVNFYLRRQDPQNAYNLQSPDTELYNPLKKFRIIGRDKLDLSNIIYKPEDLIGLC